MMMMMVMMMMMTTMMIKTAEFRSRSNNSTHILSD